MIVKFTRDEVYFRDMSISTSYFYKGYTYNVTFWEGTNHKLRLDPTASGMGFNMGLSVERFREWVKNGTIQVIK